MRITEPTTMITDYLLAVLGLVFGWRLLARGRKERSGAQALMGGSFFAMALAAAAGGTAHGFAVYLGGLESSWVWKLTVFAIGLASAAMLAAAVLASLTGAARIAAIALVVAKLALYLAWMSVHDDFRFVIYDYVPSMLAVVVLLAAPGLRWRAAGRSSRGRPVPGAGWIAAGVAVSFAAAAVQRSGFALHPQFNHNDLYHVIQMAGLYLLYRGALLLRDR